MKRRVKQVSGKFGKARLRRIKKTRSIIRRKGAEDPELFRMTIVRSNTHIACQVFTADGAKVIASASSVDKDIRDADHGEGKVGVAKAVGKKIALLAKEAGVKKVAFDRSGYRYHGRIKALADAVREQDLQF